MFPYLLDIPKEFDSYTTIEVDNVRSLYHSSFEDNESNLVLSFFHNLNNSTSLSELDVIGKNHISKNYFGFERLNYQLPLTYKNKFVVKANIAKITKSKPKPYITAI